MTSFEKFVLYMNTLNLFFVVCAYLWDRNTIVERSRQILREIINQLLEDNRHLVELLNKNASRDKSGCERKE